MEGSQVWVGNAPGDLAEADVLEVLSLYGVRAKKLVLRHRGEGRDSFGILTFASPTLARAALEKDVIFHSGARALLRRGLTSE